MSNRYLFSSLIAALLLLSQCSILNIPSSTTISAKENTTYSSSNDQMRKNLVDFAIEQKGVKYNYGGRSPRGGFDCSGFTHYVYEAFDIDITPVSRVQETEGRKITLREVKAGDLVFFRRSKTGSVFHVALVVDHTPDGITVVHSTSSRGVVVENISKSSYWKPKISSARSFI